MTFNGKVIPSHPGLHELIFSISNGVYTPLHICVYQLVFSKQNEAQLLQVIKVLIRINVLWFLKHMNSCNTHLMLINNLVSKVTLYS